ncbi:MAG TPA: hypothetical protein EYP17_07710 [Candidatus Latescibacteria bacterium]|nr:hypothetical protein [Candidatus Latescibacterota bacterium]
MADKKTILEEARRARKVEEDLPERSYKVLTFQLGKGLFGVEVRYVERVVRIKELKLAEVPGVPEYIVGVTTVGGEIVPVVDLGMVLGLREEGSEEGPCLLMVRHGGQVLGFRVDSVEEILDLPERAVDPPAALLGKVPEEFLKGEVQVGEGYLALLDMEGLMRSEALRTSEG